MSGESSLNSKMSRNLRREEISLLRTLLKDHELGKALSTDVPVRDLSDGGMGSIEFLPETDFERRKARCIAEADYMDSDGTRASFALNVDQHGRLFELDIWKMDFSPLQTYPSGRTIRNIRQPIE